MRSIRLLLPMVLIACGDNRAAPDARQGRDSGGGDGANNDGPDVDGPPATAATNLTNLTPAGGTVVQRADFGTPFAFKPDSTAVAVVANFLSANMVSTRMDPYVIQLDGSSTRRLFDATTCGNGAQCDATLLAWAADGTSLYAMGDILTNNEFEVFELDPAMTDQTPTRAVDVANTGDVINLFTVGAGGGATRIWAVGNWLTSASRQAGGFLSSTTLPVNTANPPPAVVPASGELSDTATANVFDARGNKVAFVADATVTGRFDLYVANADGTSPTLVVTGQAGVDITSVSLSPDGTKVAYLADSLLLDNAFDLFVVASSGGVAKQLSPARPLAAPTPSALNVFFQFEWSSDSKFVAFSADLVEDRFDQAYVVDTDATVPAAVELLAKDDIAPQAAGAQGVRGKLLFDADNNIFFRARVTMDSPNFTLFKATTGGTRTALELPPRADSTTPDAGAFGISPDGQKLVFSADSPNAAVYDLYLLPL